MKATLLQHTSSPVRFDPTPADPREQSVLEGNYALPQPGVSDPIYMQAIRGSLPAETCSACGYPNAYHLDTSGIYYVGCHGVPARLALKGLVNRPLRDVAEWGDDHPAVSSAVRDVLLVGAGQDVAYFYNGLTADERLHLSRRLASIAVTAYLADEGRK
jgi:hypothetical protein